MAEDVKGSTWITTLPVLGIQVGAGWAIVAGIIEDEAGKRKLRVAKGQPALGAPQGCPIKQVQKFNVNTRGEALAVAEMLQQLAALLPDSGKKPEVRNLGCGLPAEPSGES